MVEHEALILTPVPKGEGSVYERIELLISGVNKWGKGSTTKLALSTWGRNDLIRIKCQRTAHSQV